MQRTGVYTSEIYVIRLTARDVDGDRRATVDFVGVSDHVTRDVIDVLALTGQPSV